MGDKKLSVEHSYHSHKKCKASTLSYYYYYDYCVSYVTSLCGDEKIIFDCLIVNWNYELPVTFL